MIAPAQEPDGYLNTVFGRPGQRAAVQRPRVGPRAVQRRPPAPGRRGPARARRATTSSSPSPGASPTTSATTFGRGGIERVGGHPEIELGLAELARVTGEQRYLDQAALFVERRGRGTLGEIGFGQAYFQDDVPIREATVFRGHAVRALYLAAGAVDVAVETGDDDLLGAADRAVGGDHRPAHLPHRRDGLAPHGRGVRRRLRAAAGPRLLGDLRRHRLGDARLAAAARHRRDRASPTSSSARCTTSWRRRRRPTAGTSSTPTRCTNACPARSPERRRREQASVVEPARTVVPRRLLPDQRGAHAGQPRRLPRHRRRRGHPDPPVRRRAGSRRRSTAVDGSPSRCPRTTRVTARSPSGSPSRTGSRGRSRCASHRGPPAPRSPSRRGDAASRRAPSPSSGRSSPATRSRSTSRCGRGGRRPTRASTPSADASPPSADRSCYCAESVDLPDGSDVEVLTVDPTVAPRDVRRRTVLVAARSPNPTESSWPYGDAPGSKRR